ncbi:MULTISPECIES: anthrone oxygenase family protein [unclassified Streptomyces]|uniref:anthrone oxygenase family protein n=1 Tax=unclassified Streptomyces TaxID=2593676 RepID=UPI00331C14E3
MVQLVGAAALVGSGLISGVFFAVAVSVLPALNAMTPDRYLQAHSLLGKGYHPTMPLLVNATLVADIVLAVAAPSATIRSLLITSIVGIVAVEAVSHLCNVPLNKVVRGTDSGVVPVDWQDPRPRWRMWHMIRTVAALLVLTLNSLAITLAH